MSNGSVRLTRATRDVLDVLIESHDDEPMFGFRLCELADLGPGSVYPILERLAEAGWVESWWETGRPSARPRRRYYRLTGAGRLAYADALAARQVRHRRWTRLWPAPGPVES